MALLMYGVSECPLCTKTLEEDQRLVATTHFIESQNHPLWRYSDAGMHYDCFQNWEHRALFIVEYNRLFGSKVWGNGTKHPMSDDGTMTTIRHGH